MLLHVVNPFTLNPIVTSANSRASFREDKNHYLPLRTNSSSTYCSKVIAKVKIIEKRSNTLRSRSQGKTCWYTPKGLATRKIYVKNSKL